MKLHAEYLALSSLAAAAFSRQGSTGALSTAASSFLAAADRSFICQGSRARPTATI
jgi:hypothetical protein